MSAGMDGGAFTGLTVAGLAATLAIGLVIWPAAKTRQSAEQASFTAPRATLPDTTRILDILSSQPAPSAQDRQAASALNEAGDRRLLNSAWYRRADQSAACLRALANDYRARPAGDCVDLERLDACLGPPLPLP